MTASAPRRWAPSSTTGRAAAAAATATGLVLTGLAVLPSAHSAAPAGTVRIAVGGPVTDEAGQVWGQDRGFVGGRISRTTAPIAGASADALFQTERYDLDGYHIPVAAQGRYEVTLRLAETHFDAAGKRVFDVTAEASASSTGSTTPRSTPSKFAR